MPWHSSIGNPRADSTGTFTGTPLEMSMLRIVLSLGLLLALSGCGLSETASTTAALGEARAAEAKAAQETQARIEQSLDDARAAADQQRAAMEEASQ